MYFKKGKAKVEIAVAKGKKQYDKRQTKKKRDWNREKARLLSRNNKWYILILDQILILFMVLDLIIFMDLAQRSGMKGIQEWMSFYFKSPMHAEGLYPEHDIFIQSMKLKNTLRFLVGEETINHLGLDYYYE